MYFESEHRNRLTNGREKMPMVEILRGLAALGVCLFHMIGQYGEADIWSRVTRFGAFGVDAFFVISAFVIPLSLSRRVQERSWVRRFFYGRFWRLFPAFFAAIVLALGLWWLGTHLKFARDEPFHLEAGRLIKNATLTAGLFGGGWYNGVFWTLAIEWQFYIVIALAFRFLWRAHAAAGFAVMAVLAFAPLLFAVPNSLNYTHFFHHSSVFVVGLAAFRFYVAGKNDLLGWFAIASSLPVILLHRGIAPAIAALIPFLAVILARGISISPLIWLGTISYSLYLTHAPVGEKALKLLKSAFPTVHPSLLGLASVPVCLFAALVMYHFVERPSLTMAARFTRKTARESKPGFLETQQSSQP